MYFNNRNNQVGYGMGCSIFGCLALLMFTSFIIRGSLYLFFRYFWLILVLGAVVWVFRKFIPSNNQSNEKEASQHPDWSRDFENKENSGYHNVERDFEEIDEDEDDDFSDF